jgi:23S rRNA-/tRNA-specific pseudouridylate synthase
LEGDYNLSAAGKYTITCKWEKNEKQIDVFVYSNSYSVTIDGKPYTEVEFNLETGRRNQIRVHSQYIGHPIAGDKKYGAQTNPFGRLALHAQGLAFIHPWTGKTMRFTARVPKSFKM